MDWFIQNCWQATGWNWIRLLCWTGLGTGASVFKVMDGTSLVPGQFGLPVGIVQSSDCFSC